MEIGLGGDENLEILLLWHITQICAINKKNVLSSFLGQTGTKPI